MASEENAQPAHSVATGPHTCLGEQLCSFAGSVSSHGWGQRRERVWVSAPPVWGCRVGGRWGGPDADWPRAGVSLPFLSGPDCFEPPGPVWLGGVGAQTRGWLRGPT